MRNKLRSTLAGALMVGAAGFMATSALPSNATQTSTSTAAVSGKPILDPANITYVRKCWGPSNPSHRCDTSVAVPIRWSMTKLSIHHARFQDKSKTVALRVNGRLSGKATTVAAATRRERALQGATGLKIVSRVSGATPVLGEQDAYYTTLTYTYRDSRRGTRWVATRFVGLIEGSKRATVEITVAGRTIDRVGLTRVLAHATQTVAQAG
jgi:hypothetical protein